MQGKGLDFARVFDVRALRVIVADVADCYAALACVHERLRARCRRVRRLHRPAQAQRLPVAAHGGAGGRRRRDQAPVEIQIRTRAMHEHAEHGVAAHWAYKEAGARGYAGVGRRAAGSRRRSPRRAGPCCASCWPGSAISPAARAVRAASRRRRRRGGVRRPHLRLHAAGRGHRAARGRRRAIDFAYALHTDLGHRCRGARVDGAMVPLNTPLASGQTVEIVAAKEGGPSLDWLNPELGYLQSPRARAKVRAWFNALAQRATIARGREAVEKLLQREGTHRHQARRPGGAAGLQQRRRAVRGGRQGRVLAAQHRGAAAPARAGARRGPPAAAAARARRRRRPRAACWWSASIRC